MNDNLIANVFQLTVVVLGVSSAFCGYFVAYLWSADGGENHLFIASLTTFGFLSGVVVGLLLSSILNSATSMVFVAFAEDPESLKVSNLEFNSHKNGTPNLPVVVLRQFFRETISTSSILFT